MKQLFEIDLKDYDENLIEQVNIIIEDNFYSVESKEKFG